MDGKLEERILAGVLKPSVCGEGKRMSRMK
jgi:hypothetical protein